MSWQLANGYGHVRGGEVDSGFELSRSWTRRDTLMKSSTIYVALGLTKISTDKMFSEQQVLYKRAFNAQSVSPTFTKSICVLNNFK